MWIRDARPDEADELTRLVLRSKAHWGYDAAYIAACAPQLALRPAEIVPRRAVVAEDDTGLLGVATLDGAPPDGGLGLLFVEPAAIRRGVGRTLYAHVLDTARALGFRRLTLDADPHAEGFYRELGARPVPVRGGVGAQPRFEVPLPVRAGWAQAWTDGRRAVHLGNVGEFQEQFGGTTEEGRRAAGHYSCLAAFASPHPAVVVLPRAVPDGWIELVARQLGWARVELYEAAERDLFERPALVERLRGAGLPFVPWGHTSTAQRLAARPLPPDALRYESKRASHELFRRLAPDHPGVVVPDQWWPATRRAAARIIAVRARTGVATVLKGEHGAGGSGVRVLTRRTHALGLPRGPLLLEEHIAGDGRCPTYDGLVDARGEVHDVGVAAMDIRGTAYRGATVGPGAVPAGPAAIALRFGHAVGRELAATGYRGWYDVDFVTGPAGVLAPTETNLRMTGPSVAFLVKQRLDETRGGDHLVRTLDRVPLGARLPDAEAMALCRELMAKCAGIDTVLVPSIPTAAYEPDPYLGVVLAAATVHRLDAADALVHAVCQRLTGVFG